MTAREKSVAIAVRIVAGFFNAWLHADSRVKAPQSDLEDALRKDMDFNGGKLPDESQVEFLICEGEDAEEGWEQYPHTKGVIDALF